MANGAVQKDPTILPSPTLVEFFDVGTETTNELITINGLARIRGSHLRFDDQAADEGIFLLLPAAGGSAVRVDWKWFDG